MARRSTTRPITEFSHGPRSHQASAHPPLEDTRSRSRHPEPSTITLTPNDAHRRHPLPPPSTAAPPSRNDPPWYAYTSRVPGGETDDSDDQEDTVAVPIPGFSRSPQWLREYQEASADPSRPKLPAELTDYTPQVITTWNRNTRNKYKHFQDAMLRALSKEYTTRNHSKVYIKVPESAIENLALCFLKADMLDDTL